MGRSGRQGRARSQVTVRLRAPSSRELGFMNAILAGFAMGISLTVVTNSLRLGNFKPKSPQC